MFKRWTNDAISEQLNCKARVPTLLGNERDNTEGRDTPVQRTSQNERGESSLRLTLVENLRHFSVPRLNYAKRKNEFCIFLQHSLSVSPFARSAVRLGCSSKACRFNSRKSKPRRDMVTFAI